MSYVYICDACRSGRHVACEVYRDIPTGPDMIGGGHCICSHGSPESRSSFERSVWEQA